MAKNLHLSLTMTWMPTLGTTNFEPNPFDAEQDNGYQQEGTVEYELTSQTEIYHPPAHDNFKNSGGTPATQLVNDEKEFQTVRETSENKNHESTLETPRNPEHFQNI